MRLLKPKTKKATVAVPSRAQEIALEFMRISKLAESGEKDEAWQWTNVLYKKYPDVEACLKFNEQESTVRTFSMLQVRNPINTGSIARWRNYEKHLGPIIAVLEQAGIQI